jgi:nucleoside-diphosphate-sugar epimerase
VQGHLGDRVVPRLMAGKDVTVMRSADTAHTWTATQDVARLLVTVAQDEQAWGRPWHVPSNPPRTQREAIGDLCHVAGVDPVKVKEYPPLVIRGMGLFNPLMRELPEVAYQLEDPFILDSTAAQQTFDLKPTPWDDVLADVIASFR